LNADELRAELAQKLEKLKELGETIVPLKKAEGTDD
jgi:hypothetical protein